MKTWNAQFTAYTSSHSATTANGTHPNESTCAAPKEIAFGTKIKVQGTGTKYDGKVYTVTDRGSAVKVVDGRYIFDLWMETEAECRAFGRRNGKAVETTEKSSKKNTSASSSTNKSSSTAMDIVDVAISQIGANEADGSHMKYINWYGGFGKGTPWCAIFVSWCANQAGIPTSVIPKCSACVNGKKWFSDKGKFRSKSGYTPKRGDIVFFLNGRSHTGIVEKVVGSKLYTIEGNTRDKVARRNYALSESTITGYGVPDYISRNGSNNGTSGSKDSDGDKEKKAEQELAYWNTVINQKSPVMETISATIEADYKVQNFTFGVIINNWKKEFSIPVLDGAELSLERVGTPGKFTFKTIPDKKLPIQEGNAVLLTIGKKKMFYGFVFSRDIDRDGMMSITAYDQIRYLKNQDTITYKQKSADEVIRMLASMYQLRVGSLAKTGYKITRNEEGQTLLDMIQNALDETLVMKGETYVFYDKVGKLTLTNLSKMKVNHVISENTAENYSYQTSIDSNVYNRIRLIYKNDETGATTSHVERDDKHISEWGVLQYTDTVDYPTLMKPRAKGYLQLYNQKAKSLSISGVIGNTSVIAGSLVPVILNLVDTKVSNYMLVEKVAHKFSNMEHKMDLTLSGGGFYG